MSMKNQIEEFCRNFVLDKEGWEYRTGMFVNNTIDQVGLVIDPLWSFSADSVLTTPLVGLSHRKLASLHYKILGKRVSWLSHIPFKNVLPNYKASGIRFYQFGQSEMGNLESIFNDGVKVLNQIYTGANENELLMNIPPRVEGAEGVKYCLVKAYLGDLEYLVKYLGGEIPVKRPVKAQDVEKILAYFSGN